MKLRLVRHRHGLAVVSCAGAWSRAQEPTDPPATEKLPARETPCGREGLPGRPDAAVDGDVDDRRDRRRVGRRSPTS